MAKAKVGPLDARIVEGVSHDLIPELTLDVPAKREDMSAAELDAREKLRERVRNARRAHVTRLKRMEARGLWPRRQYASSQRFLYDAAEVERTLASLPVSLGALQERAIDAAAFLTGRGERVLRGDSKPAAGAR